jgi:hypothetical protein
MHDKSQEGGYDFVRLPSNVQAIGDGEDMSRMMMIAQGCAEGSFNPGNVYTYMCRHGCLSLDGKRAVALAEIPALVSGLLVAAATLRDLPVQAVPGLSPSASESAHYHLAFDCASNHQSVFHSISDKSKMSRGLAQDRTLV